MSELERPLSLRSIRAYCRPDEFHVLKHVNGVNTDTVKAQREREREREIVRVCE